MALWWVNGDILQEGFCHTQVYCTQSPCPQSSLLLTCTASGDTQTQFYLWVSGSWCAQGSVFAHQKSVSQSCVSYGASMMGLMATSSKRAYAIPKSVRASYTQVCCTQSPCPSSVHCLPVPPQETLKQFCLRLCGVSGTWSSQGLFEPSEHFQ